ncbi:signal peptidase I [Candidatus Enterococcus clewellii]|uniref:Signal peptidase I n=1 Tax=Candidatus Enterococcus clewellii TaxID=1834193 RepID=A0A242K262_9ENTE|nr:signal peptidase I [Enterococcus sp. 9E7_DIV0242]OTP11653.1 signal peptidase I [Enterococcus sp. 9E7_DIV0242]
MKQNKQPSAENGKKHNRTSGKRKKKQVARSSDKGKRQSAGSERKKRKPTGKAARQNRPQKRKGRNRRWRSFKSVLVELTLVLFIFCLLLIPVFRFLIVLPEAGGYAMSPTLQDGTRTLVYRQGKIKRFSLVYFTVPQRRDGTKTIRRVIGLPGERVEYKDERLFINGEEKVERFLASELLLAQEEKYRLTEDLSLKEILGTKEGVIPQGFYLVLGDNRVFSVDSREYGLVSEKEIIGVVALTF